MTVATRNVPDSATAAEIASDLWFRRQIEHLHRLGPRVLGELFTEIGEQRLCRTYLEQRIQRYAEIDPKHLVALEAEHFPRPPLDRVRPLTLSPSPRPSVAIGTAPTAPPAAQPMTTTNPA